MNLDKQIQSLLCYRYTIPQGVLDFSVALGAMQGVCGLVCSSGKRCLFLTVERLIKQRFVAIFGLLVGVFFGFREFVVELG